MENQMEPLELLRYTRHDWLNRLQIIQGQLYLGNTEKVQQYISEIIATEKNASYFTQLKCKKTALFLFTHNWSMSAITIMLKGEGTPRDWSNWDERIYEFVFGLLRLLEVYGDLYESHPLHITAHEMDIYFDYSGKLSQIDSLRSKIEALLQLCQFQIEHTYLADDEVSIHLRIK